jgi:DNA-binding transcriptional ArsR family regulator
VLRTLDVVPEDAFHPALGDVALTRILAALSDPGRLRAVRALACGEGSACTELRTEAGMQVTKSTMSHHLRIMREAGLVQVSVQGSRRVVTLRRIELDAHFPGLLDAVLQRSDDRRRDGGGPTR